MCLMSSNIDEFSKHGDSYEKGQLSVSKLNLGLRLYFRINSLRIIIFKIFEFVVKFESNGVKFYLEQKCRSALNC